MRTIKTKIKGMQFVLGESYPLILRNLHQGQELRLHPEPGNKADPNAISVWTGIYQSDESFEAIKLGYLSAELAKDLKYSVQRATAEVLKITGDNFGANILIKIRSAWEAQNENKH